MGFFRAIFRFFATLFGLGGGSLHRATDAMLTASPDTIRAQFREAQEKAKRQYQEMLSSVSELTRLHLQKTDEAGTLNKRVADLTKKMEGAISAFKSNSNPKYREAYAKFAGEREKALERVTELETSIASETQMIEAYKAKLTELQNGLSKLKEEEAQTVADIVSSRQITELNEKLKGLSVDTTMNNLEAIREARSKAKATAKLSNELSGVDDAMQETALLETGNALKFDSDFDAAVGLTKLFNDATEVLQPPYLPKMLGTTEVTSDVNEQPAVSIDKMFSN